MFKVALVGTHGVNKTTLAYELAGVLKRRGKTVELITEIARECPFPLNEQGTREAYQWIIARQIQLEIEKSPRAAILVCDRAVLDNFAYYARRFQQGNHEYRSLHSYCRHWMTTYDLLVRLPITHTLTADGFRSTDSAFQKEIDQLCDELFESDYSMQSKPSYIRGAFNAHQIADLILQDAIKAEVGN
ncbi:MAG: AAA family ATPase [Acidobacteriota bacterium]